MEDDLRHLVAVGPKQAAPGGTIQALKSETGSILALHFRADLRQHELIQDGMAEVVDYVSNPGVHGISPLIAWDRAEASFAYPVPTDAQLLASILPSRPDPKAALQLIAAVVPTLAHAATAARAHSLYAHGSLSPWRIAVDPDGMATVIGYGVPPLEILSWLDEETDEAPNQTVTMAPPERIEDQGEDLRSDLFSLGMIAGRIALGREVITGRAAMVIEEILAGAASREMMAQDALPAPIQVFLASLLERKIGDRPKDGEQVAAEALELSRACPGEGLDGWVEAPPDPDATMVRSRRRRGAVDDDLVPMPLDGSRGRRSAALNLAAPSPAPARSARSQPSKGATTPAPELTGNPSLDDIKAHGRDIVKRSQNAVTRATAAVSDMVERQDAQPDLADLANKHLADAESHALRAQKSAASAAAAAQLLDLDDDAPGALITLDLVRNGEQQCMQSAQEAERQVTDFDRAVERHKQQVAALSEAHRRAAEHADRAADLADQADQAVTALEEDARSGALGAEGVNAAIDEAVSAAARSHSAEEDARNHARSAAESNRTETAIRHTDAADRSATAAQVALQETLDAADRARRLEADGRQVIMARATEHAENAEQHASAAEKALERADEAIELITSAEASDHRKQCSRHTAAARRAANTAGRASEAAARATTAADAKAGATTASQAAGEAAEELDQAKSFSDKVVALAGEAAARRARVSKARAEGTSLAEGSARNAGRAREEIDKLLQDTQGVVGARALTTRSEAVEFVQSAERAARRAAEEARAMADLDDLDAIEARLEPLRQLANKARSAGHRATERAAEARDQAEREIAEQRRLDAARAAAKQAASEARGYADTCAAAVLKAWTRAKEVQAVLEEFPVEDAEVLRKKALEIIDIAEFQAGEAAASADMAEGESDPGEARAHAQTALSFAERISADLPEAIASLDEAEGLARRETEDLERARNHTAEVQSSVIALAKGLARGAADLRPDTEKWATDAVIEAQSDLDALLETMDEDVNEAGWARDRALAETAGTEALALIPVADAVLQRAKEKDRTGNALKELLVKAVQEASASANAIAEARKAMQAGTSAATDALTSAIEASRRLDDGIAKHKADSAAVHDAKLSIREATSRIRDLGKDLAELEESLEADPAKCESTARTVTEEIEAVLERAIDAEARGLAAAEDEARSRMESDRRRLEGTREEAQLHVQRVEHAVARLDEILDDAEDIAETTQSEEARKQFDAAFDQSEQVRSRMGEVERLAREARNERDPKVAETHTTAAKDVADEIVAMSDAVTQAVQQATDLSRAAQADAEALDQVKVEVQNTLERADEEVRRAKEEAKRVLGILREAPRDQVRAVAEQATGHVQTATQAAAKVRAAAPMANSADTLDVAQNILRASRLALERARGAADAVQDLVGDALERARSQKEALAKALDDARHTAMAPITEAQVELKKAEGWLDAGRRALEEHGAVQGVMDGWQALQAQVTELSTAAATAIKATEGIAAATTLAQVRRLEQSAHPAAKTALEAASAARESLQGMRDSGEAHRTAAAERQTATEAARLELQEHVETTEQIVEQSTKTVRELNEVLAEELGHHEILKRFTDAAEQGVQAARDAADRARALRDAPRDPDDLDILEGHADEGLETVEQAMAALEKVAVCETAFREKLIKLKAIDAVNSKKQAESAATEQAAEEAERQEVEDVRDRRMAERRDRFRRRQAEREPATEGETPRSRLRRRTAPASDGEEAEAPRPRRRKAPENQTGALRGVRSWSPASAAEDAGAPNKPRRPARPRPERTDNPNETKADALLERLRRNKPE